MLVLPFLPMFCFFSTRNKTPNKYFSSFNKALIRCIVTFYVLTRFFQGYCTILYFLASPPFVPSSFSSCPLFPSPAPFSACLPRSYRTAYRPTLLQSSDCLLPSLPPFLPSPSFCTPRPSPLPGGFLSNPISIPDTISIIPSLFHYLPTYLPLDVFTSD